MDETRQLHFITLAGNRARIERFHDREHLVVPVLALKEGVVHAVNSEFPEFVPAKVLSASGWDGRPLVIGHPTRNGEQVSANDPAILEKQGFGFLAQARAAGGKLGFEAWCDIARLEALGETRMLEDLRLGKPVEISIGAGVHIDSAAQGEWEGKKYRGAWLSMSPDHLAFLPRGRGACSLEMGCGAHRTLSAAYEEEDFRTLWEDKFGNDYHGRQVTDKANAASEKTGDKGKQIAANVKKNIANGMKPQHAHNLAVSAHQDHARNLFEVNKGAAANEHEAAADAHAIAAGTHRRFEIGKENEAAAAAQSTPQYTSMDHAYSSEPSKAADAASKAAGYGSNLPGASKESHEAAITAHEAARAHHQEKADAFVPNQSHGNISHFAAQYHEGMAKLHRNYTSNVDSAAEKSKVANKLSKKVRDAEGHTKAAAAHREAADAHGKGSMGYAAHTTFAKRHDALAAKKRGLEMSTVRSLKERLLALFPGTKSPTEMASEEAAELVAYQTLRTLWDQMGSAWDEGSSLLDELITAEEDEPTTGAEGEAAEEEMETAQLEAIYTLAMVISSLSSAACGSCSKLLAPDIQPGPRYMEEFRAAIGKAISSKNMKVIQGAHDASHAMHGNTVALGASCTEQRAMESAAPCGCKQNKETDMEKKERIAALMAHPHSPLKIQKALEALDDDSLKAIEDAADVAKKAAEKAEADAKESAGKLAELGEEVKTLRAAAANPKTLTEAEFMGAAPAEFKTIIEQHRAAEAAEKAELIGKLKTLEAFTEEQLKAKSNDELRSLAKLAKVEVQARPEVDFGGRNFPRAAEGIESAAAPNPYDGPLKALQSAGK